MALLHPSASGHVHEVLQWWNMDRSLICPPCWKKSWLSSNTTVSLAVWGGAMMLKYIDAIVAVHVSLHFHKVACTPKSYSAPEHNGWSALAAWRVLNIRGAYRSLSWHHTMVLQSHLKSVMRNLSEKTTWRQYLSTVQSSTVAAHLRLAALILLLVRGFRSATGHSDLLNTTLSKAKNVINIIESDKVINSLIIIGKWSGSFCHCAMFDISTYLVRTVETETTGFNVGCHSARTVLAVTWRRLLTIALRCASFLAVLLTVLRLQRSWRVICLWDMPVLCRSRTNAPFPSRSSVLRLCSKWRNTDIAFTITGGIYRLSADNPNAMAEVKGLITMPQIQV